MIDWGNSTGAGSACSFRTTTLANFTVNLQAKPADNETFTGWGGACTGANPYCDVTLTGIREVTAQFSEESINPTFAVLFVAKPSNGLVVSDVGHDGGREQTGGGLRAANNCSVTVPIGASSRLEARPLAGFAFDGWLSDCRSQTRRRNYPAV